LIGYSHPGATRFFFQAEDGIRDFHVTGVQTCALPILMQLQSIYVSNWKIDNSNYVELGILLCVFLFLAFVRLHTKIDEKGISIRSEERRVGKECRSRWSPDRAKEKSQIIVYDQTAGLQ